MRCNLQCLGCYAGNYTKNDDLPPEIVERIIKEGEEIGTYFYTILGGEPFVYPDLLDIVNRHPRSVFQIFTNATLLDERKIERFWKSKNVVPVLSIEGGKEETDYRRGVGVYEKVVNAMDLLKKAGIPFGYSITPGVYPTLQRPQPACAAQFYHRLLLAPFPTRRNQPNPGPVSSEHVRRRRGPWLFPAHVSLSLSG